MAAVHGRRFLFGEMKVSRKVVLNIDHNYYFAKHVVTQAYILYFASCTQSSLCSFKFHNLVHFVYVTVAGESYFYMQVKACE